MSLLVTFEILGLLVNTLTSDDKYSLRNSKNLPQPTQMQLSKKTFSEVFAPFPKFTSTFEHSEEKMTLIGYVLLESWTAKNVVR